MADSTDSKTVEGLKTEIVGLKIRLKRIEDFIQAMPVPEDYVSEEDYSDDDLFEEAVKIVEGHEYASASLLQRRLAIGYARAARLIDILESKGIVGPADGTNPRKVLINKTGSENDK